MRNKMFVTGLVLLLVVTGCSRSAGGDPEPARTEAPTASRQSAAEVDQTLASLRRLDDLPLYEMTYVGGYDPMTGVPAPSASPFGCSLFAAAGDPARPLFARNFDWDPNPAMLLRTDPPDGYASVSMVDLSYLGVGADPTGDRRLLNAPLLPFDGMNERGLVVGLAADDQASAKPKPGRPTVGSVRILRLVLDHAATVAEAAAIFASYNLDFEGGPPLHYLIADAAGASAVVEFVDGEMRVELGRGGWQALTNVPVIEVAEATRREDRRYATVAAALTAAQGRVAAGPALEILRSVVQSHTRWSVTYEPRSGAVRLVSGQRWEQPYERQLTMTSRES